MELKNINKIQETFTIQASPGQLSTLIKESADGTEYLLPRIEAIHAGRTRNFNHYLAEKLKGDAEKKSGVYSWTHPYNKPVIYNHDTDTKATGRVITAAYTDYTSTGKPGIIIVPKITDPEAIQAIKDGRLLTVSIGATTDSVICSITGKDIMKEGFTGYQKGEYYDGKLCEWILGDLWFDEVSWVNVPADENAQIIDVQSPVLMSSEDKDSGNTKESATRSLQEYFGVPKGVPIFVPTLQEETDNKINIAPKSATAENVEQEDSVGMELAENEVLEQEVEVTEEETPEVEAEETEVETEVETTEDEVEVEETEDEVEVEETEVETEELPAEETPVDSTEESTEYKKLMIENATLKTQVEELTKELKEHYISDIVSIKKLAGDKKESYSKRLEQRSLESLKDTLLDIKEELSVEETTVETKKVTKVVKSPIGTQENLVKESKAELSEAQKIEALASLFRK